MAEQDDIFEVRLRIKDPEGFIAFIAVDLLSELPISPEKPASQTAYKVAEDGNYYEANKDAPTVVSDYSVLDLYLSDARIGAWIDSDGIDSATCKALDSIITGITFEMRSIKSNSAGADSTEYQNLKDVLESYKFLRDMCTENKQSNDNNNSGRYFKTERPTVAGGNI